MRCFPITGHWGDFPCYFRKQKVVNSLDLNYGWHLWMFFWVINCGPRVTDIFVPLGMVSPRSTEWAHPSMSRMLMSTRGSDLAPRCFLHGSLSLLLKSDPHGVQPPSGFTLRRDSQHPPSFAISWQCVFWHNHKLGLCSSFMATPQLLLLWLWAGFPHWWYLIRGSMTGGAGTGQLPCPPSASCISRRELPAKQVLSKDVPRE